MAMTPEERKARKAYLARLRYNDPNSGIKEKQAKYRKDNLESYNKYRNQYRTKNPSGIFDVIKQSSAKRNLPFNLTRPVFVEWFKSQKKECIYCMRSEEECLKDKDIIQTWAGRLSIDRLDNNNGYEINNIALACRRCNHIKANIFTVEEMKLIGKIINKKYASI